MLLISLNTHFDKYLGSIYNVHIRHYAQDEKEDVAMTNT